MAAYSSNNSETYNVTDKSETRPLLVKHDIQTDFVAKVSEWIAEKLQQAVAGRGKATLVVSGGRTPAPIFDVLAQKKVPWQKVVILLADERWVAADHEASNTGLVLRHLMTGPAAAARFLRFPYSGLEVATDAALADQQLDSMQDPFDVVLLGMGDDGHTASLFPCAPQLQQGLSGRPQANCLAVTPAEAPHARLSLTLPRLLNSRNLLLLLQGQSKLAVFNKAMAGENINEMPVRGILQQHRVPVWVHWCP